MWDPASDVSQEEWNSIHQVLPSFPDWQRPDSEPVTGSLPAKREKVATSSTKGLQIEDCGATLGVHVWRVNRGGQEYLGSPDRINGYDCYVVVSTVGLLGDKFCNDVHAWAGVECEPDIIARTRALASHLSKLLQGGRLVEERTNGSALLELFGISLSFSPSSPQRILPPAPALPRLSNRGVGTQTHLLRISATGSPKVKLWVSEVDPGFSSVSTVHAYVLDSISTIYVFHALSISPFAKAQAAQLAASIRDQIHRARVSLAQADMG